MPAVDDDIALHARDDGRDEQDRTSAFHMPLAAEAACRFPARPEPVRDDARRRDLVAGSPRYRDLDEVLIRRRRPVPVDQLLLRGCHRTAGRRRARASGKSERWKAPVHGKLRDHSNALRHGLPETLILRPSIEDGRSRSRTNTLMWAASSSASPKDTIGTQDGGIRTRTFNVDFLARRPTVASALSRASARAVVTGVFAPCMMNGETSRAWRWRAQAGRWQAREGCEPARPRPALRRRATAQALRDLRGSRRRSPRGSASTPGGSPPRRRGRGARRPECG